MEMPLFEEYREYLKSDIADIRISEEETADLLRGIFSI